jgi:hypothetical protein
MPPYDSVYPDQSFYTSQVNPGMFGPSMPPVFNSGLSQLLGPQAAAQIDPMLQMGQLFLPMIAPQLQQQGGFMPQFFSTQNYMSQMRARQFAAASGTAMQKGVTQTADNLFEVMRGGLVQLQGKAITPEQEQSIRTMSTQVAPFATIATQMMPSRIADALYGNGGNPLRLNQGVLTTGQTMFDPITGARGLSGETAAAIGERIYNRLYGSPAAMSQMMGTGTAELADLLDNLKQRGLLGAQQTLTEAARNLPAVTAADASIDEIRKRAVARGEVATNESVLADYDKMRRLATAGDPASIKDLRAFANTTTGQEILRAGDADRIARKLKDYNEAIVAIRDIFGETGRADAPMAELMASLDQLTQGGLATSNPADLARSVRKTYELGRMNNFSMPVIQGLMAQASAQAQAAGLDPQLSVNISQNAMAFGSSSAIDRFMQNRGFGSFNREKLLLTEMNLQTGAAASPVAQRLGALVAMSEQGVKLSPELERMVKIAKGEATGDIDLAKLSQAAVIGELASAGVSEKEALGYLRNSQLAQENIAKYDIGNVVRAKLQPQEFRNYVTRRLTPTIGGNQKLAAAVAAELVDMGAEGKDYATRTARISNVIQAIVPAGSAEEQNLMREFKATNRAELDRKLSDYMVNTLQSDKSFNQRFGQLFQGAEFFSDRTTAARTAAEVEAETAGAFSALLAPLGRGNAISNFIQNLKAAGKSGNRVDLQTLLSNSLGVVTPESLNAKRLYGEADALRSVMRLTDASMAMAAQASFGTDKAAQAKFAQNLATATAIMQGGEGLTAALKAEEAKLNELNASATATEAEKEAQRQTIKSLQYIQGVTKYSGLGEIIAATGMTKIAVPEIARTSAYNYAQERGLLSKPNGSKENYTQADITNMDDSEFEAFIESLRSKAKTEAEKQDFSKLEEDMRKLTASANAGSVAAATPAKIDVNFPDKLNIGGSVSINFETNLLTWNSDTYGAFDHDTTPPAPVNSTSQPTTAIV